jgi:hypothetical protein
VVGAEPLAEATGGVERADLSPSFTKVIHRFFDAGAPNQLPDSAGIRKWILRSRSKTWN